MTFDINYLAVVVSALISMLIGSFWYSPAFLGNQWIKEMKWEGQKPDSKKMAKQYSIMAVSQIVMAYVLAHFVQIGSATTFGAGAAIAGWIWLGFIATIMTGMVTWEGKSWKLYAINTLYWLVTLIIMGGILAVWR